MYIVNCVFALMYNTTVIPFFLCLYLFDMCCIIIFENDVYLWGKQIFCICFFFNLLYFYFFCTHRFSVAGGCVFTCAGLATKVSEIYIYIISATYMYCCLNYYSFCLCSCIEIKKYTLQCLVLDWMKIRQLCYLYEGLTTIVDQTGPGVTVVRG